MWKPIVTAPKDGSFVLICDTEDPSELMIIARWRFGAWRSKPTPSGKSIVWMDATHWMPLPEMPNGQGKRRRSRPLDRRVRPEGQKGAPCVGQGRSPRKALGHGSGAALQEG